MEEKAWGAEEEMKQRRDREPSECIIDIREHDIAYYLRVAIDLGESLAGCPVHAEPFRRPSWIMVYSHLCDRCHSARADNITR